MRGIREAVGARGKNARERTGSKAVDIGVARVFKTEQHTCECALRPWEQQMMSCARLEAD